MFEPPFVLFSGTSHPSFSKEIAKGLGIGLGNTEIELFPDGEIGVQILENVRGRDVFVVQSIARKPNFYLMELLILIDALKRASARSIVAVIPYFGYARQDRKDKGRVPITAKLVADLLQTAGVSRLVTMDLHSEQIEGFFNIPVENLRAQNIFVEEIQKREFNDLVACAPDIGSAKLARKMASALDIPFAMIDKERMSGKDVASYALMGDVQRKDVLLVDDICSTGETLKKASRVAKEGGASQVLAVVTHPLFQKKIEGVDHLFVANTIPMPLEIDHSCFEILSVAGVFGKAIECIVNHKSVHSLVYP